MHLAHEGDEAGVAAQGIPAMIDGQERHAHIARCIATGEPCLVTG